AALRGSLRSAALRGSALRALLLQADGRILCRSVLRGESNLLGLGATRGRHMTEGNAEETEHARAPRLKDAMRQARIEMAERSGVVVDLRDAELARLELLNQALDPVYA